MIGEGWAEPQRESTGRPDAVRPRVVAVVTGSRAEFGLLAPVMEAVNRQAGLELRVIAAGSHLVSPALTFRDVKARFEVADSIPMQTAGRTGRYADVEAVGRGVARFGRSFELLRPDWVVVLGDRIEAFAAASAASIAGLAVCHLHGGDRAEGVADEAMRHAITKLAHLHLPATETSATRIRRMGEPADRVLVVGSPALDELHQMPPVDDAFWAELGEPEAILLWHPIGKSDEEEEHACARILEGLRGLRVLALHPNLDPGRDGILRALMAADGSVTIRQHLQRPRFVGALKRLAASGGVLVGNSSSGLIEAPALGCPVIDLGVRQAGREAPASVVRLETVDAERIADAVRAARRSGAVEPSTIHGTGDAGARTARLLSEVDPHDPRLLRKRFVDV